MPSPSRYYSSTAAKTTLSVAISNISATIEVAASTNFPSQEIVNSREGRGPLVNGSDRFDTFESGR